MKAEQRQILILRILLAALIVVDRIVCVLKELQQEFVQRLQDRAQQDLLDQLQATSGGSTGTFQDIFNTASGSTAQMVNLLRDSDFNISDAVYLGATYTTPDNAANVPAYVFAQANNVNTQIVLSTTTVESAQAIRPIIAAVGSMTATGHTLTSTTAIFAASQVGYAVYVAGAGAPALITTISAFTDSTHVDLTAAAVGTVSGALIRVYPSGITTGWRKDRGELEWGGSDRLFLPLKKKYIAPGVANNVFLLAIISLNNDIAATPIDPTYKLRFAIWDNSTGIQKIIEGAPLTASATRISGVGGVTRHYVIKYITPTSFWFSSVSSPASVVNTADPGSGTPGQVEVSFTPAAGVGTYEIYRSDSVAGLGNYYRIAVDDTGITTVQDVGGRAIGPYAFADINQQALAEIVDIGDKIINGFQNVTARILTPPTYDVGTTTDAQQYLILDIVDANDAPVTIDPFGIRLDRLALSLFPGVWAPSADDQAAPGDFVYSGPDPSGGNPSGGGGTPGGGGKIGGGGGGFLPE